MTRTFLSRTWRSPLQSPCPSPIRGIGIFAAQPIRAGEIVEVVGGRVLTEAEFREFQRITPRFDAIQIGEELHLVEETAYTIERGGSINHSCDSNLWMADEVTVVARRNIAADEELTIDYALFTSQPDWELDEPCNCQTAVCRHTITGNDWRIPEVQERYDLHFSPFLNARIKELRARKAT